jgi:hypothetical protein
VVDVPVPAASEAATPARLRPQSPYRPLPGGSPAVHLPRGGSTFCRNVFECPTRNRPAAYARRHGDTPHACTRTEIAIMAGANGRMPRTDRTERSPVPRPLPPGGVLHSSGSWRVHGGTTGKVSRLSAWSALVCVYGAYTALHLSTRRVVRVAGASVAHSAGGAGHGASSAGDGCAAPRQPLERPGAVWRRHRWCAT